MTLITNQSIARTLELYLDRGEHPLEPYQEDVLRDVVADTSAGFNSGYIKRPTGTGKTVIFSALIDGLKDLIFANIGPENDGALIVVDTANAALQAFETLTINKRRDGTGRPLFGWSPDEVKIFYGSGPQANRKSQTEALQAPVIIMTLNAYYSRQRDGFQLQERRPIGIIDEVDASKGPRRTPYIRALTKNNHVWGFSATDKYIGPEGLVRIGPELFGRPLPIHDTDLPKASVQKEISPIRNIILVANLDSGIERSLRLKDREYNSEENQAIVDQPGRDDAAIKAITEFVDPETGIAFKDLNQIWYCYGVEHAKRIAARLSSIYLGVDADGQELYPHGYAVAVSGETPKEDRIESGERILGLNSILALHKQGVIPVLANADLLIRSFDAPATELCVMLRATRSPSLVEQAGGRISRLYNINPFKLGYVASFVDRDMTGALVFTDVSGSAKLGMIPGKAYATRNAPRFPKLDRLRPDHAIDVKLYVEPKEIAGFLQQRRQEKEKLLQELSPIRPDDFLTENEFSEQTGLSLWIAQTFFKAVKKAAVSKDGEQNAPLVFGEFNIPAIDVASYRLSDKQTLSYTMVHKRHLQKFKTFIEESMRWGRNNFAVGTFSFEPDWFAASEIAELANAYSGPIFRIFNAMVPSGEGYMRDLKHPMIRWQVSSRARGKLNPRCIHKRDLARFIEFYELGTIHKNSSWFSPKELTSKIVTEGKIHKNVLADVSQILARWKTVDRESQTMRDPVTGIVWIAQMMQYASDGGENAYAKSDDKIGACLFKGELERFKEIYSMGAAVDAGAALQDQPEKEFDLNIESILPPKQEHPAGVAPIAPVTPDAIGENLSHAARSVTGRKSYPIRRIVSDHAPLTNDFAPYVMQIKNGLAWSFAGLLPVALRSAAAETSAVEAQQPPLDGIPANGLENPAPRLTVNFERRLVELDSKAVPFSSPQFLIFYKLLASEDRDVTANNLADFIGGCNPSRPKPQVVSIGQYVSTTRSALRSHDDVLSGLIVKVAKNVYRYVANPDLCVSLAGNAGEIHAKATRVDTGAKRPKKVAMLKQAYDAVLRSNLVIK